MKKWMSKYSQQLFLSAVLLIICAVLAGKSEYFFTWKNIRNILEAASYRMILAVGMTFVIASGVMDLSAGSIVSLCGVLTALALHGGIEIWAAVLTGIAAGGLMGALNGALIHCTGINFFVLTLASGGMLRGISLMITDGKPITKFGKAFMQLGIGRIGEFQFPVLFALTLILLSSPLMFHVKWGNYVQALGGSETALKRSGVRTGFYRISVHVFLGITAAVTAVIMGGTPIRGGNASIAGTVLAVLILGIIRNGLTLLSVSSDFQQWVTGFLLLASVLISEIRVWNTRALIK